MDTLIINIEEKSKLKVVKDFLKTINIEPVIVKDKVKNEELTITQADTSIDPFMLFGVWENCDIDAKNIRNSLWQRFEF